MNGPKSAYLSTKRRYFSLLRKFIAIMTDLHGTSEWKLLQAAGEDSAVTVHPSSMVCPCGGGHNLTENVGVTDNPSSRVPSKSPEDWD